MPGCNLPTKRTFSEVRSFYDTRDRIYCLYTVRLYTVVLELLYVVGIHDDSTVRKGTIQNSSLEGEKMIRLKFEKTGRYQQEAWGLVLSKSTGGIPRIVPKGWYIFLRIPGIEIQSNSKF